MYKKIKSVLRDAVNFQLPIANCTVLFSCCDAAGASHTLAVRNDGYSEASAA